MRSRFVPKAESEFYFPCDAIARSKPRRRLHTHFLVYIMWRIKIDYAHARARVMHFACCCTYSFNGRLSGTHHSALIKFVFFSCIAVTKIKVTTSRVPTRWVFARQKNNALKAKVLTQHHCCAWCMMVLNAYLTALCEMSRLAESALRGIHLHCPQIRRAVTLDAAHTRQTYAASTQKSHNFMHTKLTAKLTQAYRILFTLLMHALLPGWTVAEMGLHCKVPLSHRSNRTIRPT